MPPKINTASFETEPVNGNSKKQIHKKKKGSGAYNKVTIGGDHIAQGDSVVVTGGLGKIWAGTISNNASPYICNDLDLIRGETISSKPDSSTGTEDLSTTVTNSSSDTSNIQTTTNVTVVP